jgi:hypothetical protein
LPPRRPDDLVSAGALAFAPMPPSRPIEVASIGPVALPAAEPVPVRPAAAGGPSKDDRAALQALFAAVATPASPPRVPRVATSRAKSQAEAPAGTVADAETGVAMRFSKTAFSDLSASSFSGPAVKPLPVLR